MSRGDRTESRKFMNAMLMVAGERQILESTGL
jgi:hypothetical protein